MTITVVAISTTGLVRHDRGPSDPAQPRLVAMSAALYSPKWEEKASFSYVTKPESAVSSAGAVAVHGVTERERELYGLDFAIVMASFMRFTRLSKEVAAFNMPFLSLMIDIELDRLKADAKDWNRGGLKKTCLLQETGNIHNSGKVMTIKAAHEAATGLLYEQPEKNKHIYDARAAARVIQCLRHKAA